MAQRTDKIQLDGFTRDESTGFIVLNAKPTRAGIFTYRNADGSERKELRHPDEVFKADSMKSLQNKPFTDLHPMSGKVTTNNSKSLMVGLQTGEVTKTDDDFIQTKITVTDADMISKIESGEQLELSCGYDVNVIDESGVYNGEHYDAIQKNIKYNHIASVPKGRAGAKARIYCDSADDAATLDFEIKLDEEEKMTTKTLLALSVAAACIGTGATAFKSDAITFKVDSEDESKFQPLLKRDADLVAYATELQSKLDAAQGTIDELKTKADKTMSAEDLNELAGERADVLGVAAHIGLKDFESLDNNGIKKAVVEAKNDGVKLDDKSDDYVSARFDAITEQIKADTKGFKSLALLAAVAAPESATKEDAEHKDGEKKDARETYLDDTKDMHKDTLKPAA